MESSEDDKDSGQKRSNDRGKRKSSRKRKRKESKKGKSKATVSSDDDNNKESFKMSETKQSSEHLLNSLNDSNKTEMSSMKEKRAATLPRARQSRSNSGRRTLRDLFRRSPAPKPNRSESADRHADIEEDEIFHDATEDVTTLGQETEQMDYTKYDPALQPRNRLRYMTVQEAVKERHSRRSPGRTLSALEKKILTERNNARSASLPDISAAESVENVTESQTRSKKPHRSKSADILRRQNKPSRQEVPNSKPDVLASEALQETIIPDEAITTTLETHFPSNESREGNLLAIKPRTTPKQNRLNLDLHNSDILSSNVDRTSFAESESNKRESFNRFLHLRSNLPHFSNSSIARAKHYDSSPNEGSFNILDYIAEQSHNDNESHACSKTEALKHEEKGQRKYVRCPSYEEVMREKMALEKEKYQQHSQPNDSNKSVSRTSVETGVTDSKKHVASTSAGSGMDKHDTVNAGASTSQEPKLELTGPIKDSKHIGFRSDSLKSTEGTKPIRTEEKQVNLDSGTKSDYSPSERQSRARQRAVYVSPRRFVGRSSSNEKKSKDKKDSVKKKDIPSNRSSSNLESTTGSRTDKVQENNSNQISGLKDNISDKYSRHYSPLTSNIPNRDTSQVSKPTFKYTRSFSPRTKPTNETKQLENVVKSESKSVQTDDNSKLADVQFTSTAVNTDIDLSYDFSNVTPANQIPVIIESIQESKTNVENLNTADLPRKLSARSTISEKSAGSENEDNLVYKTPEASPVFTRKKRPSTSSNIEGIHEIADEDNKSPDEKADEGKKGQGKPKGRLSILSIVALKRRLVRQRKLKNETVVSRQDSEVLPKIDEKDNSQQSKNISEEDEELKNKNIMFLENETNISLSKLSEMDETDIIDDSNEKDETIFPTKHIKFDKGDEPIASDAPLEEDVILRDQQGHRRINKRRESRMIQKRKEVINCCKKFVAFLFSHIGLCSLMVAYSILGGIIFKALESPHEENTKIRVTNVRNTIITNIVELAVEVKLKKQDRENLTTEVETLLKRFQTEVYTATELHGWNNEDDTTNPEKQWSFASSLLFAITVMTTIGYGHVAPKTDYGRIVTILYAVFGIPLTLLCLTNIGDLMATGFRMLYSRVCCGICCILFSPKRRRIPDPEKGLEHQDLVIQGEEKSPEVVHVPTSLCIVLMTSYILLGTLLFSIWEGWDAITGTYFSFITLSTIGFGDVVPGTAMDQWASEEKLVLCAMYLVFGLSLIAMCFNLVQEDVKAKCRWLGAKIGIF